MILVGFIHQFQLFQAIGQVIVLCGQPCGGGLADLIRPFWLLYRL